MRDVVLIGAGGHGRVVLDILRAAESHRPVGFIDADPELAGKQVGGAPVLGQANILSKLRAQKVRHAIVCIGDNLARRNYAAKLQEMGFELISAIHPRSVVSPTAAIGVNVVIAAGAVVSAEASIADSVIINTSAIVDHECQIAQAAHICPGAALAGRVRVGKEAFIGLGCRIIPCLRIGNRATVGAGAVVIEDVEDATTVVGVPARPIHHARFSLAAASSE